ncbi:MAG: LL-diaminopimelate aminotransferase [Pseudanabaenaceae cyanobacterium]
MQLAQRLAFLGSNVFADMDRAKHQAQRLGRQIIDLSLGASDLPAPPAVLSVIRDSLAQPNCNSYVLFAATKPFREAIARWLEGKFQVRADPDTEILPLIGSQEGIAHLPLAVLNPGDYALLADPGYPAHFGGVYLAGGQVYSMPLGVSNNFLPDWSGIPPAVLSQARLLILSYPHNPTSALAPLSFFQEAVQFCQAHNLVLLHDAPYIDMVFTGQPAPIALQADPDKAVTIEFFTLSKSYHMGGFRIGFAVGNRELIGALRQVKSVIDFNQYIGIMQGAITALESDPRCLQESVDTFRRRRDALVSALHGIGWQVPVPQATLYVWAKLPSHVSMDSVTFCQELVLQTGVALSPGAGFGKYGEGYVRFALVQPPEILATAAHQIGQFLEQPKLIMTSA